MPYSNFKTIDDVKEKLGVKIRSGESLFYNTQEIAPSDLLNQTLKETISLALSINTEKARSELMVIPMLLDVRRIFERKISLFSGSDFNVDETLNLNGYCDFLISASPDQVFIEVPVVCIVEAKNENIRSGYPQCMAEMVAAKIFNDRQGHPVSAIIGVVTTGNNWRFLIFKDNIILIDFDEYLISQTGKILGIFSETIRSISGL